MRREETKRLAITAVFAALLIVQTFVPNVGYVRIIPALPAVTTIPMTIAVYGTLMGQKAGLGFGLFWGYYQIDCCIYSTWRYGQLNVVPKSGNFICTKYFGWLFPGNYCEGYE